MEYAACGSLTSYVAEKWQTAQHSGLFLSEDEARYFFRVRVFYYGLLVGQYWPYKLANTFVWVQQFISAVEYCHTHFVAHR